MARTRDISAKTAGIWLGLFIVLALALRIAFNIGPAFDEDNERYLYSGNDPYYHDRAVDHIVATGQSLVFDEGINYPHGSVNPNPPLYDWLAALDAGILDTMGVSGAVSLSLNLSVAVWGALTVIPVFMVASSLAGRRAGVWAAFFMAVSAPHIQRSVFGFADHDATAMFWITLAFAFLIKAIQAVKPELYMRDWTDTSSIGGSFARAAQENKEALLWSTLSGIALAAVALTWKGYPYALAILAVAFGFQILLDHFRHKDSTPYLLVYFIPILLVTLIPLPYYASVGLMATTIQAGSYVLIGMLVAAAVLVPTRELPSILVLPVLLITGLLGLLIVLLVFPEVGRTIFTGLGYFQQSKLYTTIAEAQRTELGFVVANMGFFSFFLGLWGLGRMTRRGYKGDYAALLMASWGVVAFFMALAASRFVFNASPVFAVLASLVMGSITSRLGLEQVRSRWRSQHGQGNVVTNGFRSLTGRASLGVAAVAFLLVIPNGWFGLDAAASSDFENEHDLDRQRWGAFGIGFDLKRNGWLDTFDHLATLDQDVAFNDRPGFIAWWDYGHWATSIGKHPTVADPFQNQYNLAGRFLASESEDEAMRWLVALLVDNDRRENSGALSSETLDVLGDHGVNNLTRWTGYDGAYDALTAVEGDEIIALYDDLAESRGSKVGYLGVDFRMYPISARNTGIFYAPAFLADKNPDDFVQIMFRGSSMNIRLEQYDFDEDGKSYRLEDPRFIDQNGKEWEIYGDQAYEPGRSPATGFQSGGIPVQRDIDLKGAFHDTMYARAYGSPDASIPAGDGLRHWRAEYQALDGGTRLVALLKYYTGTTVEGHVRDSNGEPMSNVQVTFRDGFGATHDMVRTDSTGAFSVIAPPGDDLEIVVMDQGNELIAMEHDIATDGGRETGVTVTVPLGSLGGTVFRDLDGDGVYNASNDEALAGANVSFAGQRVISGGDGSYAFTGVQAGSHVLTVSLDGYQSSTTPITLGGGESLLENVALRAVQSEVTLSFLVDGSALNGIPIDLDGPTTTSAVTNATGIATVRLDPGSYTAVVDHVVNDEEGNEIQYSATRQFTVQFGGGTMHVDINQS